MAASTVLALTTKSKAAFIAYYQAIQNTQATIRTEQRSHLEEVDKQYQREKNLTQENLRAQAANKAGDASRFQDMTVPVVMPQVEAAVTYQTSVFLTGSPLFGVVSSPVFIDEALQLETVIEDDSIQGGWARQFMLFFRDGFKYNFSALEVDWANEVSYTVETDLAKSTAAGIPKKILWSGNRVTRLDPYNTFVDPRVNPTEVYKDGEYAGYTQLMTRIKLKQFIASLPEHIISSVKDAFASGTGALAGASDSSARNYYVPSINPRVTDSDYKSAGTNWLTWAGLSSIRNKSMDYKDIYEVTTVYVRILPSEFELAIPSNNTPQVFKLHIVNHEHIIYCERQTNAHNYLPILIGQPLEDGLGYQTKSLADNGTPFQELASAYMSSIIASRRRAITDRVLFDPSRITSAAINSANPSAKIPVRPAAYGKPIGESVYQFPYREDQAGASMQQMQAILGLANSLSGQNLAQQGQFVKGNKTLHEFESVMQNANGRDQLASIVLEHQVFMPLKQVLKLNILQFQGGTTVYNRDKDVAVEIDPIKLRKAVMSFRVSDGLIPKDKLINADSFQTALQVIGSSPQIAGAYNLGQAFSYLMKTQGADIAPFEKSAAQQAYEQAVQQWQAVASLLVDKGLDPEASMPPMPVPEQFGYNPTANKPTPAGTESSAPSQQAQGQLTP